VSAHFRYRAELRALATDEPIRAALGLEGEWRRTYARFFPDEQPFAVLTLQSAGRMLRVDVYDGLRFDATEISASAEIVRYHPGRRLTVRDGDRFGKIGVSPELLDTQRELWTHRHELGFAVAEPLGYDERTRTLWLGVVPGREVWPAPELAERMGAALATLHRSSVRPANDRQTPDHAGELIRRVPELRDRVHELLADPPEPGPPRPLHGAPHPPQWLLDGAALGLIDFDRLALGDPEADVATFMEAAAAEDGGGPVAEAFARGYGQLDPRRLDYYRRERRVAKALRAASALRPDGDERAARRLR
jgi:aminoglycoside phosphotransferase (APT) family kinase protein